MATLFDQLTAPLPGPSPCGEDCSYETEFEAAKAEMEKMSGNDFALIEAQCLKLLTRKSKDMRALGYYCLAAALTRGLSDFGEAVCAYSRLVEDRWNDIHPRRPAARQNALKWLNGDRVVALLQGVEGSAADGESLLKAEAALETLKQLSFRHFPDQPPSFAAFTAATKAFAARYQPAPPPPPPAESRPAEEGGGGAGAISSSAAGGPAGSTAEASGPAPSRPAAGALPAGPLESLSDADTLAQKAAQFYLQARDSHPFGYRLMRLLRYGALMSLPPEENKLTPIPPPDGEMIEIFQNLFVQKDWGNLAKGAEQAFTRDDMLFFFDLQRLECAALQGLGGEYAACARAIMVELADLFRRLPGLLDLSFSDGRPFADAGTRDWILGEVKALSGGGGAAGPKRKGDAGEEAKQAEALVAEGKLEEALSILRGGLLNDSSRRNGFERRLLMADACYKSQKPMAALSLLEGLAEEAQRHDLALWEPELHLEMRELEIKTLDAFVATFGAAPSPSSLLSAPPQEIEALRSRRSRALKDLARIDPARALRYEA